MRLKHVLTGPYKTSFWKTLWWWVKGFNLGWRQARKDSLYMENIVRYGDGTVSEEKDIPFEIRERLK